MVRKYHEASIPLMVRFFSEALRTVLILDREILLHPVLPKDVDAFQKKPEAFPLEGQHSLVFSRPGKAVFLEPLDPQAEARVIPVEHFHHSPSLPEEDKVVA